MTALEDDLAWFKAHRDRAYRARLATPAEVANLDRQGMGELAQTCFVYALVRYDRANVRLQTIYQVREPEDEMGEDACRLAWHDAAAIMGGRFDAPPQ